MRKLRLGGLRTKIILWAFGPTAIILGAVALVTFSAYQQATADLVVERDREITRLLASQLATELERFPNTLAPWARTAFLYEDDLSALRSALTEASRRSSVFDSVVVLDSQGHVVVTVPEQPNLLGQNWADREYFRRARALEETVSNVVTDGPQGARALVFAVPIAGLNNEFLGVVAGMFRLDTLASSSFYASAHRLLTRKSGSIYVVDGNGIVIYHPDATVLGQDLSSEEIVRRALTGETGSMRLTDAQGDLVVVSYSPVPGTPWVLLSRESWASVASTTRTYQRFLIALLILGLLIPALIVTLSVGRLMRPIGEIISAAQEIASGDFSRRIIARTGDEIEALAEQFNVMAAQLQESYANLEQRVADRTRELAALNRIASVVSRSLDLDEVLHDALRETLQVMEIEVGGTYLLDRANGLLTLNAHQGLSTGFAAQMEQLPLDEAFFGAVVREGTPLTAHNGATGAHPAPALLAEDGIAALAAVPLSSRGEALGTLFVASRTPRRFTDQDVQLLTSIGSQIGVAVDNARLYERARQAAALEERNRLAHDLHDAVSQTLWTASLLADVLPTLWEQNPEEGRRSLDRLRLLTRGALAEMRTLLLELRPAGLAEVPLGDLLRQLTEAMIGRKRMNITLEVRGECGALPAEAKIALYRIAQESLNNVAKHAAADRTIVRLRCHPERVVLEVCDNGCGFDLLSVPPNCLGLSIMRERAAAVGAALTIRSQMGKGTQVRAIWPRAPKKARQP